MPAKVRVRLTLKLRTKLPSGWRRRAVLLLFLGLQTGLGFELHAQQAPAPAAAHPSDHDRDRAQHFFVQGGKAISERNLDAAVTAFGKAAALVPANPDYQAALAIARDNLATQLMQQALKARLLGDETSFRERYQAAATADNRNPLVIEHAGDLDPVEDTREALLNPVGDNTAPPITLAPSPGRHSFHLLLPAADILRQVFGAYGITPTIDSSVGKERVPFDADGVDYRQAQQMLTLATNTFLVPLDPSRVLLALDTKENRSKYERLTIETVYLPGLTANELNDVSNIARNVFEAQQATVHESNNTMTVRAPSLQLNAFNYELNEMLDGRSEILLDVDIYEVQTDHTVNAGIELSQSVNVFNLDSELNSLITSNPTLVSEIISSGLASPGNIEEIAAALVLSGMAGSTPLSSPFAYFGGGLTATAVSPAGPTTGNASLISSDTRMIDKLQLRLLDQEEGTIKIGERYPIVTSSYSNLATGSTGISGITSAGLSNTLQNLGINLASLSSAASATVPQVQYQDIGLTLTATSRVQQGRDVALKLRLDLSSLSGQTLNSNPIITNRENESEVVVKPGEQTLLFSQLTQQESNALIGLPFLSEIPGFELATNRDVDKMRDSIVVVITPRVVRLSHTAPMGKMVLLPTHS